MDKDTRIKRDLRLIFACFWLAILSLVFLSGCAETVGTDQCMRREIFLQCLKALPAGPVETKYNDWDDVVLECDVAARYQSRRNKSQIAAQCGV